MSGEDFFANEKSATITEHKAGKGRIEFVGADGGTTVLKDNLKFDKGDVVDATKMCAAALRQFFKEQIEDAKQSGILLSLHMKATMMKVSDPIIFGHCVSVYFEDVFKNMKRFLPNSASILTTGWGTCMPRSAPCLPHSRRKSKLTCKQPCNRARISPWWTPTGASPTCTCRVTSSSMLRWPRRSASAAKCGARTARNTT